MVIDPEKLAIRYNGIGKPLSHDEREILLFALHTESEERGGIAATAKAKCDTIWKRQQIASDGGVQFIRDQAASAGVSVEELARRINGPEGDAAADAMRKGKG